jgi:hypothetical protein
MADSALRVFSLNGILTDRMDAKEVRSRADATNLGPFMDEDKQLVHWVNWKHYPDGSVAARPCFSHYPFNRGGGRAVEDQVRVELDERERIRGESQIHKKAKVFLGRFLQRMVDEGKALHWCYKDPRVSDYPLSGNLLAEVRQVVTDSYTLRLPFGKNYRPDIVLLGEKVVNKPILLGAIELELTHRAELLKCLLCKSLGAPLMCVDITDAAETDITEEWCVSRLLETTRDSEDGFRRNYVFLHKMLYPVFSDATQQVWSDDKHQFLVFVKDADFQGLFALLQKLQTALGLSQRDVTISAVRLNPNELSSIRMFENEGSIAGHAWRDYNTQQYIRIVARRPKEKSGSIYRFHLVMSGLLTLHFDALVGFKLGEGDKNSDPTNPIWVRQVARRERPDDPASYVYDKYMVLPKQVSEPVRYIMRVLESAKRGSLS